MNDTLIKVLFCLSWVFSLILVGLFVRSVFRSIRHRGPRGEGKYRSFKSRLLLASLLLIGGVWCLRFAVGYYAAFHPGGGVEALTPAEEVFNSFVHTLQTFSLDEDYTNYITGGRAMIAQVFGEGSPWIGIYGLYAAVLNLLVPIAGGAILFEMISEFSPRVRLFFANLRFWTEKHYFSELSENSLALAGSVLALRGRGATLVFTDACGDDEEESGSEKLARARSMGAICMKDDLLHLRIRGRSPRLYLMDTAESSNLQTLTALLEHPSKKLSRAEIFVFSSDNAYSCLDENVTFIMNQVKLDLDRKLAQKAEKEKTAGENPEDLLPTVIPVNGIRNMTADLFMQVPLYEPLLGQESGKALTVTILGSGAIGTEFFLTTYWCGQLLDRELRINVISKEKKNRQSAFPGTGDFEGRINYINPDILETADPESDLLKFSDTGRNAPYFTYSYTESDVLSDDFIDLMKDPSLLETDYFIVALGSDEENLNAANRLRQIVGVHHLREAAGRKTVISYVIYHSDLCRVLNRQKTYRYDPGTDRPDICMHAFGDLDSIYSVENIMLEGISRSAHELGAAYDLQKRLAAAEEGLKKNKFKRFKDLYSYQSNIARRVHRKYKMYSAGFFGSGVFASGGRNEERAEAEAEKEFIRFIVQAPMDERRPSGKTKEQLLHELAWLEHRRWNAYMRTKGFTDPGLTTYDRYMGFVTDEHGLNNHKFIQLKLHPCLVECSKEGIDAEFDEKGFLKIESECLGEQSRDYLDDLSLDRKKRVPDAEDFKHWDYPEHDLTAEEIAAARSAPQAAETE